MLNVATTLSFFDRWLAHHKTTCGVTRADVSFESGILDGELAVDVTLRCSRCGHSINGEIRNSDAPQVTALLDTSRGA